MDANISLSHVAGLLGGLLIACAPGAMDAGQPLDLDGDEELGSVSLALATVPDGVKCLRIEGVGEATKVSRSVNVTAGTQPASVDLGLFPLGAARFNASAYPLACESPAGTASWIADPVSLDIKTGQPNDLRLVFRRATPVVGQVDFEESAVQIATGGTFTLALLTDGRVLSWGSNYPGGALGNGAPVTDVNALPEVIPGLSDVTQVVAGSAHACALIKGGTVKCWGSNAQGQLGDGTKLARSTPVAVAGLTGVVELAAGPDHMAAIVETGDNNGDGFADLGVRFWGDAADGQQFDAAPVAGFDRTSPSPVIAFPAGETKMVVAATGGYSHSCVLGAEGGVICAGRNTALFASLGCAPTNPPPAETIGRCRPDLLGIEHLSASQNGTCATRADGKMFCWGSRTPCGTSADPLSDRFEVPTLVPGIADAVESSVGKEFGCLVRATGEVRCWGRNLEGQLGTASVTTSGKPLVTAGLSNAVQVAVGTYHACALTKEGGVFCWGSNQGGQLGLGDRISRFEATRVPL